MISRRIVHCAKDQLNWECCTLEAREVFPQGQSNLSESRFKLANLGQPNNDIASTVLAWSVIRNRYTSTNLTRDSDRLPAISGLARKIHELMHVKESIYLAGLERDNLATEIQWKVAERVPFKRPTEYCAPTWSWASTIGTMIMPRYASAYLFEIVEAETFPLGDSYGQVSGGYLRIRGLLCQIKVIERSDGNIATGDDVGLQDDSVMINGHLFGLMHDECGIFWDGDAR
jgi:hypothetical protein